MPDSGIHSDNYLKWFDKIGKARPTHSPHGTEEDIANNMRRLQPNSWKLEGNKLIGMTEQGPLVQFIPTSHILTGTDDDGLPIFRKVEV